MSRSQSVLPNLKTTFVAITASMAVISCGEDGIENANPSGIIANNKPAHETIAPLPGQDNPDPNPTTPPNTGQDTSTQSPCISSVTFNGNEVSIAWPPIESDDGSTFGEGGYRVLSDIFSPANSRYCVVEAGSLENSCTIERPASSNGSPVMLTLEAYDNLGHSVFSTPPITTSENYTSDCAP